MKLATYRTATKEIRIGSVCVNEAKLFDLAAAAAAAGVDATPFASMLDLIDGGEAAVDQARSLVASRGGDDSLSVALADVTLLAPLPRPRQMRDAMSYELHIRQCELGDRRIAAAGDPVALAAIDAEPLPPLADIYREIPTYYLTNHMVVGAPNSTVVWPRYSKVMDYELEFGIVVGRDGKDISADKARDHIFGYTLFNDFSARDKQEYECRGGLGPAKGKSFDGSNVLGPWIVTRDELPDPYALKTAVRVNGVVRGASTTAGMLFNFEQILAYMSQDETVYAGEFIGSGTIGNGCALETGVYLQDGDEVEIEVEGIGVLRNRVKASH